MNTFGHILKAVAALATLILWPGATALAASYLDMAQEPLFAGTNAPPNILVAIDDSGSMDLETLFPNDDGYLFWNDSAQSTADSKGNFYGSGASYGYLFPFDQVQPDQTLTIPPIPEMAFARSSDYNNSYFNPATTYDPWLGDEYKKAVPTRALLDPSEGGDVIDLTASQSGTFQFRRGMVKPGGGGANDIPSRLGRVCYDWASGAFARPTLVFRCPPGYSLNYVENIPKQGGQTGGTVTSNESSQASYFPATFYLNKATALPTGYGYKSDKIIKGEGPTGAEINGYEIKPDNFASTQQYNKALDNFANWFTYYRKRHLATRGGIVAAFDGIDDVRVGACTINDRRDLRTRNSNLSMLALNDTPTEPGQPSARAQFYSSIFNIDYTRNRGTPNREALNYLGKQLESNRSIITAPCQRNFAILFTDGYSDPTTGHGVGNVDGKYGPPFADSRENTIADIAMRYYKALNVPMTGILKTPEACAQDNPPLELDCNSDLHMTTFGVTLNQSGTLFNTENQGNPYANPRDWPASRWADVNAGGRSKKQIDDLWHATINTRGDLLNATTPKDIAAQFTTALQRILGEQGAASSLSLNSSNLTGDSVAYQAGFTSGAWTGQLNALPQSADGDFGEPLWQASNVLSDPSNSHYRTPDRRVILTSKRAICGHGNSLSPAAFRFDALKTACNPPSEKQIGYLRGERTNERANGGSLRNRYSNILGDIVNSSPLYVGAPKRTRYPRTWNDQLQTSGAPPIENSAAPYTDTRSQGFAESASNRIPMVYVGANDGMLHGFDARTGEERLAYMPGALSGQLQQLTRPDYLHRYFVDSTPVSGDVVIDKGQGPEWRTVLVGALGAGGRSVYALDITDPSAFSESDPGKIVLWEFEHEELGHIAGRPSIVRLHNGRWAAVFGNGYNSRRGSAQLFIVDIATGTLVKKIDTLARPGSIPDACDLAPAGDTSCSIGNVSAVTVCHRGVPKQIPAAELNRHIEHGDARGACGAAGERRVNGLSEVFPVDLDGDFITDYVYAGDLYGNVWKFDLTSSSSQSWKAGFDGAPLFAASDDNGNRQAITSQPQVGVHPYGSRYGVMVYFGTGKYLESTDRAADTDVQNSFYGIWDLDVFTFNRADNGKPLFSTSLKSDIPRSRLLRQSITETIDSNGQTFRLATDRPISYQTQGDGQGSAGHRGWYINLSTNTGEMSITNSRIESDTVAFSTAIPNTETCAASGSGYFMVLDRRNGGRTRDPAFDLDGDGQLDPGYDTVRRSENARQVNVGASGVRIGQGIPGAGVYQNAGDQSRVSLQASDGTIISLPTTRDEDRRRSWREIRR